MAEEVSALTLNLGAHRLGVLLVGDDAASQVYVRNKELAATKAGMPPRFAVFLQPRLRKKSLRR